MVSSLMYVVSACLCALVNADHGCNATLCLKISPRGVNVDWNLFNNAESIPIEDYIRQMGYPLQSHEITTEDGYLLTYHRIRYGKSTLHAASQGPVLLQHGLLAASSAWVLGPNSLAYTLADAGFDVWLGNSRGNTYSRKHIKYDPDKDKKEFWDFSWHEMGYYDLPAAIDYILSVTNSTQLVYVGHSMGTTMYFVLGATRPRYMDKVQAAVAMAPVTFPWHIKSPLANFLKNLHTGLKWLASVLGVYEVFPYSHTMFWLDRNICARRHTQFICKDIMYYIGGFNEKELIRASLSTVLQYLPAGASFKQIRHFRQITSNGTDFQQFDYGFWGNLMRYKSFSPPSYNLTNVKAPIYIYYAHNDWLSVPEDVLHTVDHLPNVQKVTEVIDDQFNHLDFMWASDAKSLVYDDMTSTLLNLTK